MAETERSRIGGSDAVRNQDRHRLDPVVTEGTDEDRSRALVAASGCRLARLVGERITGLLVYSAGDQGAGDAGVPLPCRRLLRGHRNYAVLTERCELIARSPLGRAFQRE